MRRFFILLFAMLYLFSYANQEQIVLTQKGPKHDREGMPLYFDIPIVYYNHDNKTQEIIIDGGGAVSYYDVEISSPVTNMVEISTQVLTSSPSSPPRATTLRTQSKKQQFSPFHRYILKTTNTIHNN